MLHATWPPHGPAQSLADTLASTATRRRAGLGGEPFGTGGRISLFEPINNYFPETRGSSGDPTLRPLQDLLAKVLEYEGRTESAYERDPMRNFTQMDLLRLAENAAFPVVHVELLVDVEPGTWGWTAPIAVMRGTPRSDSEAGRLGEGAWQTWHRGYSPERGLRKLVAASEHALARRTIGG
jgi:hypothetical protein